MSEPRKDDREHAAQRTLPFLFGATSLFSDMTYELAHVLLPALMLHFGGSALAAALMESLAEGTKIGGFVLSGRTGSTTEGQSRLVRGGYALTAFATVLMGLAGSPGALVGLKSLSWFGKGLRGPARDALMANALSAADLPKAFGIVRGLDQVGGLLGPIAALGLSGLLSPEGILFLSAVPGVLCVLFSVAATRAAASLQSTEPASSPASRPESRQPLSGFFGRRLTPEARQYVLGSALLKAGLLPATLMMFRFASTGGTFSMTVAGFLLSSLMTVLANLAIARKRISGDPVTLVGMGAPLIILSVFLLAPIRPTDALYLLAMGAWGAGEALATVGLKVRGAQIWPSHLRGQGFAFADMAAALCSLILWPIVAFFWTQGESPAGMALAAFSSGLGGMLVRLGPRPSSPDARDQ